MKLWQRSVALWVCLLGTSLAGCTLEAGVSPPPPEPRPVARTGSVTVSWTIAGSDSSLQCSYYVVDSLQLVVYDETGSPVTSFTQPCEDFEATLDLYPGTYTADATLVDANQKPRSLTLPLNNIVITRGTNLTISVDFPARSML